MKIIFSALMTCLSAAALAAPTRQFEVPALPAAALPVAAAAVSGPARSLAPVGSLSIHAAMAGSDAHRQAAPAAALAAAFDGVAIDEGRAQSLGSTGIQWLSERIQDRLGLTRSPEYALVRSAFYQGQSDPDVYIRSFRGSDGTASLSLVAANRAWDYATNPLVTRDGRSYPEGLPVVASMRMTQGQKLPSNVRWRPSGRLEKSRLYPVLQLSTDGINALHQIAEQIGKKLKGRFSPSFRGKDEPEVFVTGFAVKDGKPALSIVARQPVYVYNGDPYITPYGLLKTLTISARVTYNPKTGKSDISDIQWIGRDTDLEPIER